MTRVVRGLWGAALAAAMGCGQAAAPPLVPAPPLPVAPSAPPPAAPPDAAVSAEPPRPPPASPPEVAYPAPKPPLMELSGGTDSPVDRALHDGETALDAGDLALAQRSFELARKVSAGAAAPLIGLARVRVARADVATDFGAGKGNADVVAARGFLRRAVTADAGSAAAQVELGRVLLLLGDASGAMECLRRGVALAPGEAEAHSVLGVASLATGHVQEAITELHAAVGIDAGSAARHGNLGTALMMAGDVKRAIGEYEIQAHLADGDARAHSDLGTALLAGDADPSRGIAELHRAIEIEPSRATFHSNLGYALQLRGALVEAVAEYRRAIALDPRLVSAWINLATALARDPKSRAEARRALQQARKLDPTDPRVKANLEELDALERDGRHP